jgi:hypothetical protein
MCFSRAMYYSILRAINLVNIAGSARLVKVSTPWTSQIVRKNHALGDSRRGSRLLIFPSGDT